LLNLASAKATHSEGKVFNNESLSELKASYKKWQARSATDKLSPDRPITPSTRSSTPDLESVTLVIIEEFKSFDNEMSSENSSDELSKTQPQKPTCCQFLKMKSCKADKKFL
jgi:hypothetical protein